MDNILDYGITIVIYIQGLGKWLLVPMQFFSFLGTEEFYLLFMPALYWCLDAGLGLRVGLMLLVSGSVNQILKLAFHAPRPYWYDTQVRAWSSESSFGLPSGHAQNAVAFWGVLAASRRQRWSWNIAIGLMLLIGISRLYLGVHFPSDVIVGWGIGALVLWAFLRLEPPVNKWLKKQRLSTQIVIVFVTSLVPGLISVAIVTMSGSWQMPVLWIKNAASAIPETDPIEPMRVAETLTFAGAFFGMAAGALMIFARGGFDTRGSGWQLLIRYIIGLAGVVLIWQGLGSVFPRGEDLLSYSLRYLRYTLIGFWMVAGAPWLFIKLRIAQRSND